MRELSQNLVAILEQPERACAAFGLWFSKRETNPQSAHWFPAHRYLLNISDVEICFELERGQAGVGSLQVELAGGLTGEEESLEEFLTGSTESLEAVLTASFLGLAQSGNSPDERGDTVVIFHGVSTSVERYQDNNRICFLVQLVGSAKLWEQAGYSAAFASLNPAQPDDFIYFTDMAEQLFSVAGVTGKDISPPQITAEKPFWDYYPVPRMGFVGGDWDVSERPQAMAWDEKRGRFYFGVDNHIISFDVKSRRFSFVSSVQADERHNQTYIVHLEYDSTEDRLLGVARNQGINIASHQANAHGHFVIDQLNSPPPEVSCLDVYYLYERGVKIKSKSISFTNATSEESRIQQKMEAVGTVAPDWDKKYGMGFCEPLTFAQYGPGSIYAGGGTFIVIHSKDLDKFQVGDWVQVAILNTVGELKYLTLVSDVGPITRIDYDNRRIYFERLRGLRYGIAEVDEFCIYVAREPTFTPNIFIPQRTTVCIEYDSESYERRAPVEVFRRNQLSGAPDDYIATKIGEVDEDGGLELDIGFYAFRSVLPFGDEDRENPACSPFWLVLSPKVVFQELSSKNAYICNHPQELLTDPPEPPDEEIFDDYDRDVLENIVCLRDREAFSAYGPIYLTADQEKIYAAVNGFARDEDRGMSGIYRRARLVEIDPERPSVTKELWCDPDGLYEFSAAPIKFKGDFHFSLKKVRSNYVNTHLEIVGVEYPREETAEEPGDAPAGYHASNRQSARIYIKGDVTDRLSDGAMVRLSAAEDITTGLFPEPLPREYVVQEVACIYVADKQFVAGGELYSGYVTACFVVGTKCRLPWGDIRQYLQGGDEQAIIQMSTEDRWQFYLDLLYMGDEIKLKLQDWLEDELLNKTIWLRQGYLADGALWARLGSDGSLTKLWECLKDVGEVEEGRELLDKEVGEKARADWTAESSLLPIIQLNHGDILPESVRLFLGESEFTIEQVGSEPVKSSPGIGYAFLTLGRGENYDSAWLYLDSRYLRQEFRITYRYYCSSIYPDMFLEYQDCLYAVEQGSGRWLCFDGETVENLGNLRVGQEGAKQLILGNEGYPYALLAPSGNLARYAPFASGYFPRVELDGGIYSTLCALATSADMVVFAKSPTCGVIANRQSNPPLGGKCHYTAERITGLDDQRQRHSLRIQVNYPGGRVEWGEGAELLVIEAPFTVSKALAGWLAERIHHSLYSGRRLQVELPLDYRPELLDQVVVSADGNELIALVIDRIVYHLQNGTMTLEGYQTGSSAQGKSLAGVEKSLC